MLVYLAFIALLSLGLLVLNLRPRRIESYPQVKRFRPRVLVVVPCKGMDLTLRDNLRSMKNQSYTNYRLVAVVDSATDTALDVIKRLKIQHIVAKGHLKGASGKVRAICAALSSIGAYDICVIADSDVLVGGDWLARLVAPLADKRIGMSTGFPIFRPVGGGFWPRVKYAWGFVGQGLMESELTRFGWGGTMAFRKNLLDGSGMADLRQSVSDDIALTKLVIKKGLRLAYVADAGITVNSNDSFKQLIEWSTRQTALSIAGYPRNYRIGLVFYSANVLVLASGVALSVLVNPVFVLLLTSFAVGAARTYSRDPERHPSVIPIYFIMSLFYLSNLLVARRMASIRWRGGTYALSGVRKGA